MPANLPRTAAALLAFTALCAPALAQTAQPQLGAAPLGAKPCPYLQQSYEKQWTVQLRMTIGVGGADNLTTALTEMKFTEASFNVPLIGLTGSSLMPTQDTPDGVVPAVSAIQWEIDDRPVKPEYKFLPSVPGDLIGAGVFKVGGEGGSVTAKEIESEVTYNVSCWKMEFDEARASRVDWPQGPWPESARQWLAPQPWVEVPPGGQVSPKPIADFLNKITEGKDPKQVRPVVLAKWITAQLLDAVQCNGIGAYAAGGTGGLGLTGFEVQGGALTIAKGQGTEIDMTCALVSLLREAGIPARLVIGFDIGRAKGERRDEPFRRTRDPVALIRPYAEFALYDEKTDSLGWVSIDIVSLRKRSSQVPPNFMDRPQRYFGTNEDLQGVVPLSTALATFNQPGSASSTRPIFWTFSMQPAIPAQFQPILQINVTTKTVR